MFEKLNFLTQKRKHAPLEEFPGTSFKNIPDSIISKTRDGKFLIYTGSNPEDFNLVKAFATKQDDYLEALKETMIENFIVLDELPVGYRVDFKTYEEYQNYIKEQEMLKQQEKIEAFFEKLGPHTEVFELKNIEYPTNIKDWKNFLKEKDIKMNNDYTAGMLENMEMSILPENQKFIKLKIEDLFENYNHENVNKSESYPTYAEILNRAEEVGLEICE